MKYSKRNLNALRWFELAVIVAFGVGWLILMSGCASLGSRAVPARVEIRRVASKTEALGWAFVKAAEVNGTMALASGRSMLPTLPEAHYDALEKAYGDIKPGDVISYRPKGLGYVVLHTAQFRDSGGWVTKGDGNGWFDLGWRCTPENYVGTLVTAYAWTQ